MTSETSTYLDERLAHIEKLLGSESETARCEVELGRDGGNQRHGANIWFAEFTITSPGAKVIRATNNSESINGAIDDAKAEVLKQIRREKRIHIRMWRKGGAMAKNLMRRG